MTPDKLTKIEKSIRNRPSYYDQTRDMRQSFEDWYCRFDSNEARELALERDSKGDYKLIQAAQAWNTWRAAQGGKNG